MLRRADKKTAPRPSSAPGRSGSPSAARPQSAASSTNADDQERKAEVRLQQQSVSKCLGKTPSILIPHAPGIVEPFLAGREYAKSGSRKTLSTKGRNEVKKMSFDRAPACSHTANKNRDDPFRDQSGDREPADRLSLPVLQWSEGGLFDP